MADESVTHFWQIVSTTSITIIVTMVGFWVGLVKNMVTKHDVTHMIETQSPYMNDRQFIMDKLASNKEIQAAFANALQRNSEVMNELKVQIMVLSKTLETLEDRIEK